jgi:hypothetical protein
MTNMSKTTFSTKCEILGTLWLWYKDTDNEDWSEFFSWADVGLPLAYASWQNLSTLKPEGKNTVEETWTEFCTMISIDPDAKYTDLKGAFSASPNKEIG